MRASPIPFRGTTARVLGRHTEATLRSRCVRVLPDVYVPRGVELDCVLMARAAACWAGPGAVLAGWSAATLLGARWLPAHDPEVAVARHVRRPAGLVVHQQRLGPDEVEDVDGVLVTTPVRTAYDLGRRLRLVDAVAAVDQLCALGVCGPERVAAVARAHPGDRGLVRLGEVLELVDAGAASPKESELRVLLVRAGLPPPQTQVEVRRPDGRFLARADLGWIRWRVLVEYEGAQHRDGPQFTRDVDRYAELEAAGWTVVRVTAELLARRPEVVLARVDGALLAAGARWRRPSAPLSRDQQDVSVAQGAPGPR